MLFLLKKGKVAYRMIFFALLLTGELYHLPEITEANENEQNVLCETCGLEYDDCPSTEPAVECPNISYCFKLYNTSINRLQKGCSNTTNKNWEAIKRLGSALNEQSVCFDTTKTNLEMIEQCQGNQWNSNCSFETVNFSQTSQQDVSKMTSKMCVCHADDKNPCNEGDVPGFEEIQRKKLKLLNQCYTCETHLPCNEVRGISEAVTKWCRTKYCSIIKKREFLYRDFITGERRFSTRLHRDCADHYINPEKTWKCLKSKDGCMHMKNLQKCSPNKHSFSWMEVDVDGKYSKGQEVKECICEGSLCNDKSIDEIILDAGVDSLGSNNKLIIILVVNCLISW